MAKTVELESIKKKVLDRMSLKKSKDAKRIVVGMATCGMAAGAAAVMDSLRKEIEKRNLKNIDLSQTGCVGACRLEPMIEVYSADGSKVTYVRMTPEKAARVVAEHIVNNRVCSRYTIGAEESR